MSLSEQSRHTPGHRARVGRRAAATLVALLLLLVGLPALTGTAQAATNPRIDLRVLVVSDGGPSTGAIATELDREGVPYTEVAVGAAGRPTIDASFLADAATDTAKFQAVVLPNHAGGGLAPDEVAALTTFEQTYGVRQVSAYDYPGASMGFGVPSYAGSLDGGSIAVASAGLSGPFSYLKGRLSIDNFDPSVSEVYGYLAAPNPAMAPTESLTPMLTATVGGVTGVLAGVHTSNQREELVLTAAYNPYMQWWNEVAHGVVTWMTRGIHLGEQRNYFAVNIDDVFLPDSRWSSTSNCTPGDDCVDPTVTTRDIRMTPTDVNRLVQWQKNNSFSLDMVFNGGGSDVWKESQPQPAKAVDKLLPAMLAVQSQFNWINHTYTHPFLGCIQIAPTVLGQLWHCATDPTETPRQDPEIPGTMDNGVFWASQDYLTSQVQTNIDWARSHGLTKFDPTELVTGEHSGLKTLPEQPVDNPFLAPALAATGVKYTASDASREPTARAVGTSTQTLPRYPMNIYYNTATYQDLIDEYNWYYTSKADGGSGICENNPTSTCITPLADATATEALGSYNSYLKPMEIRNALSRVLTNDPRPFYAHQSNLAENGLLYPVVGGVLSQYRAVYAANTPVVNTSMTAQSQQLSRMTAWQAASAGTDAYLDSTGVHISGTSVQVPLTVPAGSTVSGATLASYGGELSGWTAGAVAAALPSGLSGYGAPVVVTPSAPSLTSVVPGNASVTVTWTAPAYDGGAPITGYVVRAYPAATGTAPVTMTVSGSDTTATVSGLTNGTAYTLTVAAVNSAGTGVESARSAPVVPAVPLLVPAAPVLGSPTAGDRSATVSWTAPADGGSPITRYDLSVYQGDQLIKTLRLGANSTGTTVKGLTNGTAYSVAVAAVNKVGTGPQSARSAEVTPVTTPRAPQLGRPVAGSGSATLSWTAPTGTRTGGTPITGYVVSVFLGAGDQAASTVTVDDPSSTGTTVTGLTSGSSYSFTVAATNSVGTGPASRRSKEIVPQ